MTADELLPRRALWTAADPGGTQVVRETDLQTTSAHFVRNLYCATKPMVAMAFLSLLEQQGIELDQARVDPDGSLGDDGRWAVADLLWHRSALVTPTIWQALRVPLGSLDAALDSLLARAAAQPSRREGYSEVLAWYLLGKAAARLLGGSWPGHLQGIARPVLDERLWFTPDRELLDLPVEAMRTLSARHQGVDVPLVYTLTARNRALASPHLGAYGSFAAVVAWFQLLGAHLAGGRRRTPLFPSVAYLRRCLDRCSRPGQRHVASFEHRQVDARDGVRDLVGVQAAGAAISVWLDVEQGRVLGILGDTFLETPQERTAWLRAELEAAWAWSEVAGSGPRIRVGPRVPPHLWRGGSVALEAAGVAR